MKTEEIKPLLEINNLSINFENDAKITKAVDDISLNIYPGEFVALAGESGSGKTMTALSILQLLPETAIMKSGRIIFNSCNLSTISDKERKNITGKDISIIFQDPLVSLNPLMKVGKQITECGTAHGMSRKDAVERACELLEQTGFKDCKRVFNSYPHELSGGMKQRIMICAALMNRPKLLIADEPTTALDASIQTEILNIISRLNKLYGTSLLLISHDLSVVSKLCSRIYVMLNGRIIENGKTQEVISNPSHPYTRALVNAIPSYEKKGNRLETFSSYKGVL